MRIDWNNLPPVSSIPGVASRPRLDTPGANQVSDVADAIANEVGAGTSGFSANVTADALRAALLELGIAADADSMALAEVFTRLGLPLTDANIVEGRSILARNPRLPAAAYAMAKLLDAPLTPGVLRALARVIDGALGKYPLPDEALRDLSLALDGQSGSQELARDLYRIVSRLGTSTENQLLRTEGGLLSEKSLNNDPRAQLLTLSNDTDDRNVRMAADAHASHIEGQQLLNQIAINRFDPPVPLYFAFPFRIADHETVPAEVQVWTKDDEEARNNPDDGDRLVLQTVVRLSPPKLGLIEVRLQGKSDATLTCNILAERQITYRLLRRNYTDLADGLSNSGWHVTRVDVGLASEFEPLWYGGASLAHPRNRVDRKA